MQRPPGVTLELWGSLLKAHGYAVDDARGGVVLSPARAREMERENENERRGGPVGQWYSMTTATGASCLAGAFGAQTRCRSTLPRGQAGGRLGVISLSPAKRLQLDASTSFVTPIPRPDAVPEPSAPSASIPSTVFAGLRFLLYGETHNSTVRRAIEDAGGAVASRAAQEDYIVVRLVSGSALFATEPSASCWLELCPFVDRVFAPEEHPSFVPFGVELPVPVSADKITLSFSGLNVSEGIWVNHPRAHPFTPRTSSVRAGRARSIQRHGSGACSPLIWGGSRRWRGRMQCRLLMRFCRSRPAPVLARAEDPDAGGRNNKGKGKADDSTVQMQDICLRTDSQPAARWRRQWCNGWRLLSPTAVPRSCLHRD
ncbi:hypothetical protein K438DRAFT_1943177 [Mycena galopus ATCC 62051]|nr:hypothetical protein K438DRAFT_1943177 [Mycena galopus ATCC 62051]